MDDANIEAQEKVIRDFSKIRVGLKQLEDAIVNLSTHGKVNKKYGDKKFILDAINNKNYKTLREISNYFYEANGIYQRLCKYLAFLYKYDWFVVPYTKQNGKVKDELVLKSFYKVLAYLDNSYIKKLFGNIALEIMKHGNYYGYLLDVEDKIALQQLPSDYCRSRYFNGSNPVVEFNMKFFDTAFPDVEYRLKVLAAFPKEIQKGYVLYREGKLPKDFAGDTSGWYMLEPKNTVKFSLNNNDFPPLISAIPSIIDLENAQELDRRKTMQQLLKILIQKLPLDKNGDLIFDVDEAKDLHENAVSMLKRAIGVDVLTTFADVSVEDMADSNSVTSTDDLKKVERTLYNNLGVSQNLFNTDGNVALQKSISNDEASIRDLIYQFEEFLNRATAKFVTSQCSFQVDMLETTIYNYQDISKLYKEQTQIGYSKMLPQIALGHTQSSIIAAAKFENNILHLNDIMIPPLMSSTMSSKDLDKNDKSANDKNQDSAKGKTAQTAAPQEKGQSGRPEKPDDEKSTKTLQNRESMS